MKTYMRTVVLAMVCCLVSGVCLATDEAAVNALNGFYLESALGNRTLESADAAIPLKSPNEAFLYSLVLPGAGQFYTGAKRGYLYAAAEVGVCSPPTLSCAIVRRARAMNIAMSSGSTLSLTAPGLLRIGIWLKILSTRRSMKTGTMSTILKRHGRGQESGIGRTRGLLKTRKTSPSILTRAIDWRRSIFGNRRMTSLKSRAPSSAWRF